MNKSEAVMSEFDYMEDNYDEFPFSFSNEDLDESEAASGSFGDALSNANKLKIDELENFFTDLSQINQFVLTYGNKLLFKYKKSFGTNSSSDSSSSDDAMNAQNLNFSIDSSSLFMLLLEAANFLEYTTTNPFKDDDVFKSGSVSPIENSVVELSESSGVHSSIPENSNGFVNSDKLTEFSSYVENFQSVRILTNTFIFYVATLVNR